MFLKKRPYIHRFRTEQMKNKLPKWRLFMALLFILLPLCQSMPIYANPAATPLPIDDIILHALQETGKARIVIALRAPTPQRGIWSQSLKIAKTQNAIIQSLPTDDFDLVYRFDTVAGMVATVTDKGLDILRKNTDVLAIAPDMRVYAATTQSAALIRAPEARNHFEVTGRGVNVAVIDSGIDLNHPDLADHILAQHCFTLGDCPPDYTDEGSSAQDVNGHGTRVAGIVASTGTNSPQGIAPEVGVVAVRVMDDQGIGWNSDVVAAIDWVVTNQWKFDVDIINLSLGGGRYNGICDDADANTILFANAVQTAREAGITIFAASGNGTDPNAMSSPACISGVISVGSTYDANLGARDWGVCQDASTEADQVTCFSNSSETLDLLAPGAWIESASLGGGAEGDAGTSMSVPHAAGVAALMLQIAPDLTPDDIARILQSTGVPITDPRNGRSTPRIDAWNAVQAVAPPVQPTPTPSPTPSHTTLSGTVLLQGRAQYTDTTVVLTTSPCFTITTSEALKLPEIHQGHTDIKGHFTMTVPQTQTLACLYAHHPGYLEGQLQLSDLKLPSSTADLPTFTLLNGDINGDNTINIYDLTQVAVEYGTSALTSDLNRDGTVNIFDLTLLASNFGKVGPAITTH